MRQPEEAELDRLSGLCESFQSSLPSLTLRQYLQRTFTCHLGICYLQAAQNSGAGRRPQRTPDRPAILHASCWKADALPTRLLRVGDGLTTPMRARLADGDELSWSSAVSESYCYQSPGTADGAPYGCVSLRALYLRLILGGAGITYNGAGRRMHCCLTRSFRCRLAKRSWSVLPSCTSLPKWLRIVRARFLSVTKRNTTSTRTKSTVPIVRKDGTISNLLKSSKDHTRKIKYRPKPRCVSSPPPDANTTSRTKATSLPDPFPTSTAAKKSKCPALSFRATTDAAATTAIDRRRAVAAAKSTGRRRVMGVKSTGSLSAAGAADDRMAFEERSDGTSWDE